LETLKSEISKNCEETSHSMCISCRITQESCKILRLHFSDVCAECNYAVRVIVRITLPTFMTRRHHIRGKKCSIKSCHIVYQYNAACMCWAGHSNCPLPSQLQDRCLQHVPKAAKIYVVRCSCSNDRTCSTPLWSATAPSTAPLELPPIPWRRASLSPGKASIAS